MYVLLCLPYFLKQAPVMISKVYFFFFCPEKRASPFGDEFMSLSFFGFSLELQF